jgi:hypothetical protein
MRTKETLAEFLARTGIHSEVRNKGTVRECVALIPMPEKHRFDAFGLSDYFVSASVSGPCLELLPMDWAKRFEETPAHFVNQVTDTGVTRPLSRAIRCF